MEKRVYMANLTQVQIQLMNIISAALFGVKLQLTDNVDWNALYDEAMAQDGFTYCVFGSQAFHPFAVPFQMGVKVVSNTG
jgi:hypothetical protein